MKTQNSILSFINKHFFTVGVFGVLFLFTFLAGSFVVANGQTIAPSDSHVVSLYVNGEETVLPTRAKTVGELIDKTAVSVNKADLIEPARDTEIDSDNFRINVYKARPVTIIDGDKVVRTLSPHQGSKTVVEKAGLKVYKEDILTSETGDSFVEEKIIGEKITIERATPVSVSLFGEEPLVYRTHVNTVGELLAERGLVVEEGAVLQPSAETALTPNMFVYISKFGKKVVTEDVQVPFDINNSQDPDTVIGRVTVIKAGVPGLKKVTYEIDTRDGREVGRRVLQEVVVSDPEAQVQKTGTKSNASGTKLDWMVAAGIPSSQHAAVDFIIGRESGWRPNAMNAGGCAGLGQACPGSKLANVCPEWQIDPVCQLKFFNGYAVNRYGSWNEAYNFWQINHWW